MNTTFNNQSPVQQHPPNVQSYLKKLKSQNAVARFMSNFTKRWFVLDFDEGYFYYTPNANKKKAERTHSIKDLISFEADPKPVEQCDWKFVFTVEFPSRKYTLYSETKEIYDNWCQAFQFLAKPKEGISDDCSTVSSDMSRKTASLEARQEDSPAQQPIPPQDSCFSPRFGVETLQENKAIKDSITEASPAAKISPIKRSSHHKLPSNPEPAPKSPHKLPSNPEPASKDTVLVFKPRSSKEDVNQVKRERINTFTETAREPVLRSENVHKEFTMSSTINWAEQPYIRKDSLRETFNQPAGMLDLLSDMDQLGLEEVKQTGTLRRREFSAPRPRPSQDSVTVNKNDLSSNNVSQQSSQRHKHSSSRDQGKKMIKTDVVDRKQFSFIRDSQSRNQENGPTLRGPIYGNHAPSYREQTITTNKAQGCDKNWDSWDD